MTEGVALWDQFVANGLSAARELDGVVARLSAQSIEDPETRGTFYHYAFASFGLASQSLLVGAENLGRLALACERCLDAMGDGAVRGSEALGRLAAATRTMRLAFEQLANPDKSGARVEGMPLDAVRDELDAILPQVVPELAGSAKAARAAAVVARQATSTATMAAAAAAKSAAALGRARAKPPATGAEPAPDSAPAEAPADEDGRVWEPQVDEDMIELFFEEANDRLAAVAEKLVELEQNPGNAELIREIFRDLHTVKGSSGMVGLRRLNRLAHAAEDLVGQLREGERAVTGGVVDALLAALDALRDILARAAAREPLDVPLDALLARLRDPTSPSTPLRADGDEKPAAPEPKRPVEGPARQTIRVDFDKLDLLMNLVGELVLGRDELHGAIRSIGSLANELSSERQLTRRLSTTRKRPTARENGRDPLRALGEEIGRVERVMVDVSHDLDHASGRLDSISGQLRDQVMKLRMVPVGATFRKHHRTVRDLANAMGKRARLELAGEDTELDKVLVEMLDDPLMHLVRNAIDHGVESPDVRAAAGKPEDATVSLRAMHRGNQVIIEIADDGAGIDPARIRARALEREICPRAELDGMDDRQVLELIFRPGFSTAEQVSEVSGRGVGMDVVWSTIVNKLKGQVEIRSSRGAGSTFALRLPLTLAIIQVLLVRTGGETFAVPLDAVLRTTTRDAGEIRLVQHREVIAVNDRQVPLIRLADVLELHIGDESHAETVHVVLVDVGGEIYGLACEHLLGKREIVIKSLGDLLQTVPCAAGGTIIGDRCAVILDVPAIVARALRQPHAPRPARAAANSDATAAAPPSAPHILLVEDSDVVRETLARLLTDTGYRVTTARDGVEGLDKAQAEPFDLVSTDVMMPRMDGYELTRALRALDAYRDTPIVMVTSRGERIDRVRGFDAGVDEYITKPHDRSQLRRAIAKLLAARRREDTP